MKLQAWHTAAPSESRYAVLYARVSTEDQDPEVQLQPLRMTAGCHSRQPDILRNLVQRVSCACAMPADALLSPKAGCQEGSSAGHFEVCGSRAACCLTLPPQPHPQSLGTHQRPHCLDGQQRRLSDRQRNQNRDQTDGKRN